MTRSAHASVMVVLVSVGLCTAKLARAQPARPAATTPSASGAVAKLRQEFDYGQFAEVLSEAESRLDRGNLPDAERLELHRLAGLSAFNLGRSEVAERHFRAVLRIAPDLELDPFLVPPPAIEFFGRVRGGMADELIEIRRDRKAAADRAEAARLEEERRRRDAEEQRRRLEAMARQVLVRTEEKRSIFVNFIPFGVGQLYQGRIGTGLAFAAGEVALAATSVLAYFAYEGLIREQRITIDDRLGTQSGTTTRVIRGIPADRLDEANRYRLVKTASGVGFYLLWAVGSGEALWRHEDTVVREQTLPASVVSREADEPSPTSASISARPNVFLLHGGAGAGLHLTF